jgi:hypothetical protein
MSRRTKGLFILVSPTGIGVHIQSIQVSISLEN